MYKTWHVASLSSARGTSHVARTHIWLRHAAVNPWLLKNQATAIIHHHRLAANPAVFVMFSGPDGSRAKAAAASYLAEPPGSPTPGQFSCIKGSTVLILPNPRSSYFLNYVPKNLQSATSDCQVIFFFLVIKTRMLFLPCSDNIWLSQVTVVLCWI